MKKTLGLVALLLMLNSCHNSYKMPHNYLYKIDGYIIWTSHKMLPYPENATYNPTFDLFLFNRKDAEIFWDMGRFNIRFNKEPVRVLILQAADTEIRQPTSFFYYHFSQNNQLNDLPNFDNGITKFLTGVFFVKKGYVWNRYGKIASKIYNSEDVHKITFNGRDSVLIKPIWGFDYIEADKIRDPFDD